MDKKDKEMLKKMKASIATRFGYNAYQRVRCPSIKKMAGFIKRNLPDYEVKVWLWSENKGRQMSSGVWISRRRYEGKRIIVKHKKTGDVKIDHNTAETYRYNNEVASKIIRLMEVD